MKSCNKLQRSDSFKVYEWLKAKQEEIVQGKWMKEQLAQAVGQHIGKLVSVTSLEGIMSEIGIKLPNKQKVGGGNMHTAKVRQLEERIANIERQLGLTNVLPS